MINVGMLIPFFSGKCGGPCIIIKEIAPHLDKLGVNLNIYTSSYIDQVGKQRTEFLEKKTNNLKIYRFPSYFKFREYKVSFGMLQYLLKNANSIDIFHSQAIRSYQEDIAAIIAIAKNKPLIISPNGAIGINWDYGDKIPKMIIDKSIGFLKKKLLNPHFIAIAKNEITVIKNYGIKEDHIHYIPPGVNTDFYKPTDSNELRKKYNLEDSNVIFFIGRIAKGKGVDKLIRILNFINQKKKNVKLVIAGGDAGYLPIVKSIIKKFNLEKNVIITGYVKKEQLPSLYSMADIVVYPSRQEIFGMVITEAMACGKPVIGSDIMGPSEIIVEGKTGFKSDFKDLKKLSDLIVELLEDKNLLSQLGKNGLKRARKVYSWKKNAQSHFNLYKKLLS